MIDVNDDFGGEVQTVARGRQKARVGDYLDLVWRELADAGASVIRETTREADRLRRAGEDPEAAYEQLAERLAGLFEALPEKLHGLLAWAREHGRL